MQLNAMIVTYRVRPEAAETNRQQVEQVFADLNQERPDDFAYTSFVADDGRSFFHLVVNSRSDGTNPLATSSAFHGFQASVAARCEEPPVLRQIEEVGSYGFWPS